MAQFRYVAKNLEGKTVRGILEAPGESVLQQRLKDQGLYLIKASDTAGKKESKKLSAKEIALFCKELATMLAAGISIVHGMEIVIGEEGITQNAKELYQAVLLDLKRGISVSEAMETKKVFPELMLGLIRSGENNGDLDRVMQRLAVHYEKEHHLNQQVKSAMTYPMMLLAMCVVVVILMVTLILPRFEEMFSKMETLPLPTEILLSVSDFMIEQWYVILILGGLLYALGRIIVRIRKVHEIIDYAKVRLPLIGKLNKVIYSARFCRTLSSLYSSGMPLASALKIAGDTIGNLYIEEQFGKVTSQVRSGVPLSKALGEVDGMVSKLSSTILIGEESGKLGVMLDFLAQTMEKEAEEATKGLVTLFEPIMLCFMALLVGFIMIAIMLPLYQSYGTVEGGM